MVSLKNFLTSSLGRKVIMALTGIALVGFILMHLAGNLLLLDGSGSLFNQYVYKLYSWGPLLIVAELGLAGLFALHIISGILVSAGNKVARSQNYEMARTKGSTFSNASSKYMIISGSIMLLFLILHIWQFRFGPGITEGYETIINGEKSRDLFRLVVEVFQNPVYVVIYLTVMVFLGFHLRHGFWSAFQSLGVMNPRIKYPIYTIGVLLALAVSVGFLILPIWLYRNH